MDNKNDSVPVPKETIKTANQFFSWYREHEEAMIFLFDFGDEEKLKIYNPERWSFFKNLTKEKVQNFYEDDIPDRILKLFEIKPESEKEIEDLMLRIYQYFSVGDLVALYEYYHDEIAPLITQQEIMYLAKRPSQHISLADKISKAAYSGKFNNGLETPVIVSPAKKKRVETLVQLSFSEKDKNKISGINGLDYYDGDVSEVVGSLVMAGNQLITDNMIHRELTGSDRMTENQAADIDNAMSNLMRTYIKINASDEFAAYHQLESATIEGYAVSAMKITAVLNGQEVRAWKILDLPLLYRYALSKKQVDRYDPILRRTPVHKTKEQIILEGHLRRRIFDSMPRQDGSPGGTQPVISYNTVYEILNISEKTHKDVRGKKLKVRNTIKKVLNYYKSKNFIVDFRESPDKKSIELSFTVPFEEKEKQCDSEA